MTELLTFLLICAPLLLVIWALDQATHEFDHPYKLPANRPVSPHWWEGWRW